ncbi:calcium channel [Trichosporon asahii var. asahii CBS 2479]|uniref:Calcium channel n=1 Tax=Trichosporon asahii var. asahii (strain ATCC 90039 / CBS 2479 / JCM 2466 / KCTC 7840 / NBRC 103889/ NCYC 2677 / UAMH 7654) TaxID=1186058 RepID=J4U6A8_TRIAS|nr:calcium channel [Trichosporon asahii var. asahii CBS 2479]EJT45645.1 calcium channel [Trichosporon asahii var. asahii CBS 2479]
MVLPGLVRFFLLLGLLLGVLGAAPSSSAQPAKGTALAKPPYAPLTVTTAQARSGTLLPSGGGLTLNRTRPAALIKLPKLRAWSMTVWIADRGYDMSTPDLLPAYVPDVRVTTDPSKNFAFEERRSVEALSSGGTPGKANHVNRGGDTWRLAFDDGFANFTYGWDMAENQSLNVTTEDAVEHQVLMGFSLAADAESTAPPGNVTVYFQVVDLLDAEPTVRITSYRAETGFLGDTTDSNVLLFSPVIEAPELPQPQYPNYTLPGPYPDWPQFKPHSDAGSGPTAGMFGNFTDGNFTFVVQETAGADSLVTRALGKSVIALALAGNNTVFEATSWTHINLASGFRKYAVIDGLKPDTNYTFWIYDRDRLVIYPPALFRTKKPGFRCPLMLPTAMCPGIGYASPVADVQPGGQKYLTDIPDQFANVIAENLDTFSMSLTAQACGRDMYSYVSTCADCYDAYRVWVCRMVLPQCADADPAPFENITTLPTAPHVVPRSTDSPRSSAISYPYEYSELLPCIAVCTEVDRVCPLNLQFICPHRNFNANESYAFEGRKNGVNDGQARNGRPSIDRFGNRWCNV